MSPRTRGKHRAKSRYRPRDVLRRTGITLTRWRRRAVNEYVALVNDEESPQYRYDRRWMAVNRAVFLSGLLCVCLLMLSITMMEITDRGIPWGWGAAVTLIGLVLSMVYLLRRYRPPSSAASPASIPQTGDDDGDQNVS